MTLFDWLLIGHFVGDWAFQNEWMVRHKQSALFNRAVFVHCAVYTVVMLFTLYLQSTDFSAYLYWAFGAVIFVTHWLIDAPNLAAYWMRFFQQSNVLFVRIV
ncbi:MAG: DUF3307 domain-containing protein, partial [Caldilineaceae bacterium]|nr:DUF3307 domain-containing protein [Caldilineaceae bacterium]